MCTICGEERLQEVYLMVESEPIAICRDCLEEMLLRLENEDEHDFEFDTFDNGFPKKKKERIKLKSPKEIKAELDKYVIGQDEAKKVLSVAVYNHYKRIINNRFDIQKSNILMAGPTGVGKTELARTIAKILDVPFAIADATSVTEAGYVGDDVENIVLRLLEAADGDVERAEHGIIYIDEIDKIARKGDNVSITRDVSGEGVQQALLKIIEGAEITLPKNGGRKHPYAENIPIDTSNILFICGGAFEGITMKKDEKKRTLGFGSNDTDASVDKDKKEEKKLSAQDIVKAGMLPELVGRLPIIVKLHELSVDDLERILTEPVNSITKQYQDLISLDGTKLIFTPAAITFIAKQAHDNKTGARGLKAIIEEKMLDLMYELPDQKSMLSVTIDEENGELVTRLKKNKRKAA